MIQSWVRTHIYALVLFSFLGILFLTSLHLTPLHDWDECIYGGYARAMQMNRDYMTNYWNGSPIFEKLPLYSIFMQVPFAFGISEFTNRILTVIFSMGVLILVYAAVYRRFSMPVAFLTLVVFLNSEVAVRYMFRTNTDYPHMLFLYLAIAAWFCSTKKQAFVYLAGIFLACGILVKGFSLTPYIGALCGAMCLDIKKSRVRDFVLMLFTTAVIVVPVLIAEYVRFGNNFLYEYFYESHIRRAQFPIEFHVESRLFYLRNIMREFLPWSIVAAVYGLFHVWEVVVAVRKRMLKKWLQKNKDIVIVMLFIIIPLAFITRAASRLAWYALPIYPFFAVYVAHGVARVTSSSKKGRYVFVLICAVVLMQALWTVWNDTRVYPKNAVFYRQQAQKESARYPEKTLDYLVPFAERQAKAILTLPYYTTFTWRYGGSPCAVFYSNKHVNYYYTVDEFEKRIQDRRGLFLIENGDLGMIEKRPANILYSNNEYTLFRFR